MSKIILIRHAETDMAGTFCGQSNPALNDRGRTQLAALVHVLAAEPIDAVYASDLLRARQTAQVIAQSRAVECRLRPGLREVYFGRWEGLTWEQVERADSVYAQRWIDDYPHVCAPGGERVQDFERRVLDEVQWLSGEAKNRCIAVVTHAGVLRAVLQRLCGFSSSEAWEKTRSYCALVPYSVPAPYSVTEEAPLDGCEALS